MTIQESTFETWQRLIFIIVACTVVTATSTLIYQVLFSNADLLSSWRIEYLDENGNVQGSGSLRTRPGSVFVNTVMNCHLLMLAGLLISMLIMYIQSGRQQLAGHQKWCFGFMLCYVALSLYICETQHIYKMLD